MVMVAAPSPALTAADARQAAARKKEDDDEEVVCFICFDGGDLVVCDWRCDAAVRDFFLIAVSAAAVSKLQSPVPFRPCVSSA